MTSDHILYVEPVYDIVVHGKFCMQIHLILVVSNIIATPTHSHWPPFLGMGLCPAKKESGTLFI